MVHRDKVIEETWKEVSKLIQSYLFRFLFSRGESSFLRENKQATLNTIQMSSGDTCWACGYVLPNIIFSCSDISFWRIKSPRIGESKIPKDHSDWKELKAYADVKTNIDMVEVVVSQNERLMSDT